MNYIGTQMCNMSADEIYDLIINDSKKYMEHYHRIFPDDMTLSLSIGYGVNGSYGFGFILESLTVENIDKWLHHLFAVLPNSEIHINLGNTNCSTYILYYVCGTNGEINNNYYQSLSIEQKYYNHNDNTYISYDNIIKKHKLNKLMVKL